MLMKPAVFPHIKQMFSFCKHTLSGLHISFSQNNLYLPLHGSFVIKCNYTAFQTFDTHLNQLKGLQTHFNVVPHLEILKVPYPEELFTEKLVPTVSVNPQGPSSIFYSPRLLTGDPTGDLTS